MKYGHLSDYFSGVAIKRLSAVEADTSRSHQHEFNGVNGLRKIFGTERCTDIPARFIRLDSENEPVADSSTVTWYDSRENSPARRSPEFRLYFGDTDVMKFASEGDLLVVAKRPDGEIMILVVAAGTTAESQILWLFGMREQAELGFEIQEIQDERDVQADLAVRFILEEMQIEIEEPDSVDLDSLIARFEGEFPTTAIFSKFARSTVSDIDARDDPDAALIAWIEQEERLFRRLERSIVSERLTAGFTSDEGVDVDGFVSFSLSVQNRRKARSGLALENHLEQIFILNEVRYERGAETEKKCRPDFLFPGATEYRDSKFPAEKLAMLGVKSTCKDRWRQVLAEAARIERKHLLTLEPGISESQTGQMIANKLQLVLPRRLHDTYSAKQREWLMDLRSFLGFVQA